MKMEFPEPQIHSEHDVNMFILWGSESVEATTQIDVICFSYMSITTTSFFFFFLIQSEQVRTLINSKKNIFLTRLFKWHYTWMTFNNLLCQSLLPDTYYLTLHLTKKWIHCDRRNMCVVYLVTFAHSCRSRLTEFQFEAAPLPVMNVSVMDVILSPVVLVICCSLCREYTGGWMCLLTVTVGFSQCDSKHTRRWLNENVITIFDDNNHLSLLCWTHYFVCPCDIGDLTQQN